MGGHVYIAKSLYGYASALSRGQIGAGRAGGLETRRSCALWSDLNGLARDFRGKGEAGFFQEGWIDKDVPALVGGNGDAVRPGALDDAQGRLGRPFPLFFGDLGHGQHGVGRHPVQVGNGEFAGLVPDLGKGEIMAPIVDSGVVAENYKVNLLCLEESVFPFRHGFHRPVRDGDAMLGVHLLVQGNFLVLGHFVRGKEHPLPGIGDGSAHLLGQGFNGADLHHAGGVAVGVAVGLHGPVDSAKYHGHPGILEVRHDQVPRDIVVGGDDHIRFPGFDEFFRFQPLLPGKFRGEVAFAVHVELFDLALAGQHLFHGVLNVVIPDITGMVRGNVQAAGRKSCLRDEQHYREAEEGGFEERCADSGRVHGAVPLPAAGD